MKFILLIALIFSIQQHSFAQNEASQDSKDKTTWHIKNKQGKILYTYRGIDDIIYYKDGFVTQVNKTHPSGVSYKLHGLLKPSGERVTDEIYTGYLPEKTNNGLFGFRDQRGFWGFINYQNKIVVQFKYIIFHDFYDGVAIVFEGEKAGVVDTAGKLIVKPEYTFIKHAGFKRLIANKDQKFGTLKTDGSILTPFEYKTEEELKETLRMPLCEGVKLVMNLVDNEAIEPYQGEQDFLDLTYDSYILIKGMIKERIGAYSSAYNSRPMFISTLTSSGTEQTKKILKELAQCLGGRYAEDGYNITVMLNGIYMRAEPGKNPQVKIFRP